VSPIQQRIEADVASHGWHVSKVAEGGVNRPAFAYTIGLTVAFGHPEVVILGLDLDDMQWMLNHLGEQVRGGGEFSAQDEVGGLLEGRSCKLVAVDPKWYGEWLGQALEYYHSPEFVTLQCLWPDRAGRFPNDTDFDASLRSRQPLLSA
jgi:Domain of unknown function (DUF4262)